MKERAAGSAGRRVAFYSYDAMGLGHLRRNLLLARAIARRDPTCEVLLISGTERARDFTREPNIRILTLPSVIKGLDGRYAATSPAVDLAEVVARRSRLILEALKAFRPDLLVVDKQPRGLCGELDATLALLHRGKASRIVLGLRDVLDHAVVVGKEWLESDSESAIRDFYDEIWVYGDPNVYDVRSEYGFSPCVTGKMVFTGYLSGRQRLVYASQPAVGSAPPAGWPDGSLVLCLVGGGQDGYALAEAFAEVRFPGDMHGLVLTGPFMPGAARAKLLRAVAGNPRLRLMEFVSEPTLLVQRASRVVAMGGYNTVCEVLAAGKPALLVPRVVPRLEQVLRVERLRDLGLVDVLHPDQLNAATISEWLVDPKTDLADVQSRIDVHGLVRVQQLVDRLLLSFEYRGSRRSRRPQPCRAGT